MADKLEPIIQELKVIYNDGDAERKLSQLIGMMQKAEAGIRFDEYWRREASLIDDVAAAYQAFQREVARGDVTKETASNFLALANSAQAFANLAGRDINDLIPGFDNMAESISHARSTVGALAASFDVSEFQNAYKLLSELSSYGDTLTRIFQKVGSDNSVDTLTAKLRDTEQQLISATSRAERYKDQLQELENTDVGSLRDELNSLYDTAEREFKAFLEANQISEYEPAAQHAISEMRDYWHTSGEMIKNFKSEAGHLLNQNVVGSGSIIDPEMLDQIGNKLAPILERIDELEGLLRSGDFGSGSASALTSVVESLSSSDKAADNATRLMTALQQAAASPLDNLDSLHSVVTAIRRLDGVKISKAALENLKDLVFAVKGENLIGLTALSGVNLSGFNDLHISKASLSNLAEYLPILNTINVEQLQRLSEVNFAKLNDLGNKTLHVEFGGNDRSIGEEREHISQLNQVYQDHIRIVGEAAQAERDKYQAAKDLAGALRDESNAFNDSNISRHVDYAAIEREAARAAKEKAASQKEVNAALAEMETREREAADAASQLETPLQKQINDLTGVNREYLSAADAAERMKQAEREAIQAAKEKAAVQKEVDAALAEMEAREREAADAAAQLETPLQKQINDLTGVNREYLSAADAAERMKQAERETTKAKQESIEALKKQEQELKAQEKANRRAQSSALSYEKLTNKIVSYYNKNESELKKHPRLIAMYQQTLNGLNTKAFGEQMTYAASEVQRFEIECEKAGVTSNTLAKKLVAGFGNKIMYGGLATAAMYVRRLGREVYNNVVEIDGAMTQLRIVTGATDSEMKQFLSSASSLAARLGKSVNDILGSIETFSRLGYNLSESSTLAEYATILSNVANVDASAATTGLTSIIKGYNLEVSDSEHIADVLINVGQKYAISASELMDAFERGGAALYASGTEFEKSAALFAASNSAIQNADKVGTAFQTVSARIRKSESELEDLGADYEDIANGMSKYRDELKALTNVNGTGGFDIMMDEDHYKDIYDIFVGIAEVWDQMTDPQRARTAEILGGTRQLSIISSTIGAIADAEGALETAMNSAGVALESQSIYADSIAGKIGVLRANFQAMSTDLLDSDIVKFVITLLDGVTKLVDQLARAKAIIPSVVAFASVTAIISKWKSFAGYASYIKLATRSLSDLSDEAKNAAKQMIATATAEKSIALGAAAVTTAVAGIASALSIGIALYKNYLQSRRDAWQKGVDAGADAKEEYNDVSALLDKYNELNIAVKTDDSVKSDLLATQDELIKKLDLEGVSVRNLERDYGGLTEAIRTNALERLEDNRITARLAVDDAESLLKDAIATKHAAGISVGLSDDTYGVVAGWDLRDAEQNNKTIRALQLAGYSPSNTGPRGVSFGFRGEELDSAESIMRVYQQVYEMRKVAAGVSTDTAIFESLDKIYQSLTASVKQYTDAVRTNNEIAANQLFNQRLLTQTLPVTEDEFKRYRNQLWSAAMSSGKFVGSGEEIMAVIEGILRNDVNFAKFFDDGADAVSGAADAVDNAVTSFEKLDKFKDAISSLNDAFDDLSADGSLGVTYSHLKQIKEQFTDVDGIDEYINRLADAGTNAEEVNKILNELAVTKVLEEAQTLAEAGANEQLIRALLEEAGVTNAAETAADTLAVAKGELALKTAIAEGSLDQFNNSLNEEGAYSDWARIKLLDLEAQMISLNDAGLDLDAQVQQIQNIGLAAGLSAAQLWNLKVAAGGATEDYVQSVADAISKIVVTPYTFDNAPKSSGGGSSKSKNLTRIEEIVKEYESATTDIQYQLNLLERQYEQLEANGDLEGMNANLAKQAELHQQLKDAAHNTADTLRAFGDSTALSAEEAAELAKQLDTLSGAWFDNNGDQGESNKQRFDNDLEDIKKRIEENGDAVNGWRQALELLDDYFNRGLISYKDYVDTRKELGQEWVDAEIEAVDDYIAATDDAVTGWKSALSSLEQAYANELISFKTYSEKHKEIGENLYNAEIDAIDKYIDRCNALNDWGTDNEVNARRKQLAVTEDYYRQGLISYEKYKDSYNSYTQELYNAEMDALEERAQQQKKRIEEQIKALEKRKEAVEKSMSGYDATVNALTDFIDKAIDALDEENSELEKQKELQEKLMEIERLKHQQTLRIYREGVGFVYEQDTEAIKEAQDAYDSLVEEMDKDRAKEKLEDLKEAIQSITSQYTDEKNAALAAAILGEGWEDTWTEYVNRMVAGGDAGDSAMATLMRQIKRYAGQYSNLSRQVDEDVKGSITSQISSLNDASDKWDEWLENVREANYLYVDELYNVTDIEAEQYDMRLDNLSDYVESSVLEYQKLASAAANATAAQTAAQAASQQTANAGSGSKTNSQPDRNELTGKGLNYYHKGNPDNYADLERSVLTEGSGYYFKIDGKWVSPKNAAEFEREYKGKMSDRDLEYYSDMIMHAGHNAYVDAAAALDIYNEYSGGRKIRKARMDDGTLVELGYNDESGKFIATYEGLSEDIKRFFDNPYTADWGTYAEGGVVDYDGPALVHGKQSREIVFNGKDANKLYNYIHTTPDLIASMLSSLGTPSIGSSFFGRIKSVVPKPSAELTGGNNASVTIGTINLHEVQNVDGLAKAIENELPGRITQMFYKR